MHGDKFSRYEYPTTQYYATRERVKLIKLVVFVELTSHHAIQVSYFTKIQPY